jgi:hypothetical protein
MAFALGLVSLIFTFGDASAQLQMADYWGFSHEDEIGGGPGQPGNVLQARGFIDDMWGPYLVFDLATYQYTWEILDLISQGFDWGTYQTPYAGGTVAIYEDANLDAWNSCDPDLISAPLTFVNGDAYLTGYFTSFFTWYNPNLGQGSFEGTVTWTGGTHLADIPVGSRNGWTFGGSTDNPYACVPAEYEHRVDGQIFLISSPTDEGTWGQIKNLLK